MNNASPQQHLIPPAAEAPPWLERNRQVVALGLAWLRALLEDYILRLRRSAPAGTFQSGGDVVSDLKADWLLRELQHSALSPGPMAAAIEAARQHYDAQRNALRESGSPAALDQMSAVFGLAPFDEDVLLLALAPRLDAAFQALYGYAHDRVSLSFATPHLVRQLLLASSSNPADMLSRLHADAPLRRFILLEAQEDATDALSPLRLDERTATYIMGGGDVDPRVRVCLRRLGSGICPHRYREIVAATAAQLEHQERAALVICGPVHSGRRAVAAAVAAHFGLAVVELEVSALPQEAAQRRAQLALIAREAALGPFALAIDLTASTSAGDNPGHPGCALAEELLDGVDGFVIVLAQALPELRNKPLAIQLEGLNAADRAAIWRESPGAETMPEAVVDAVSEQFLLGPTQIAAIAESQVPAGNASLWSACREAARRGVGTLAEPIEPGFDWEDIVLPNSVRRDLEALVAQVRHRTRVYRQWGFERNLPRGRGVSVLFAGPSGVGKTMAAEVIAHELQLDLYRIDLSAVVSKYIGETEKNLRRVFDAAEASGAVLFFDEADALFGKRSEVRDSHDRYANIEVSYLLQRMEAYSGLAVLATNLKTHLDDAFLRRLRYVIDIPFPDADMRREIWRKAIPSAAPTEGIDPVVLASLEIAGGNISVIAVNAAFLAAADDSPMRMEHIARAARAEYRKLDKEFRPPWPETR